MRNAMAANTIVTGQLQGEIMRKESVTSKRTSSSVGKDDATGLKCLRVAEWFTLSQLVLKMLELVRILMYILQFNFLFLIHLPH